MTRVVYGSIIGLAIVVALQDHPPSDAAVAASLVATAIAVALAELYSDVLGAEARNRRRARRSDVRLALGPAEATGAGVAFPAVFFLLAAAGVLATEAAFTAAKWSGVALMGTFAFGATRLTGASLPTAACRAVLLAAVGAALIVLKSLAH